MTMSDEVWWQASPFTWVEEDLLELQLDPPEIDPLDTLLDDLLPRIRYEGEMMDTDLSPIGMTEWIPGVDPVSELIEESMLPPLPPAVTTLMRSYERGQEQLPSGSGHVNIMVDLSGSMTCGIGEDSSGQSHSVVSAAQALTRIAINACRQGNHSFAVFAFGSSSGDGVGGRCGYSTRQIWGSTLDEAKDYDGYLATLKSNGAGMQGDWSGMGGTNSGFGAERLYRYMADDVGSQIPDVDAATAFFITDAYWGDISVPGLDPYGGVSGSVDIETIKSASGGGGSPAFWYWAKKYHDDYGPFVLFKINASRDEGTAEQYRKAYREWVGGGSKGYEKCVFDDMVYIDNQGGNLAAVAGRMVQFINDMSGGGGECECGGKGVSF
jgi:hypothetical protein